jgi:hypothetical protein
MLSSPVYVNTEPRSAELHPRPSVSHFRAFSKSFFFSPAFNDSTNQHANALSASRTHLRDDIQTPSKASHTRALLYRQRAPLSPLAATLTDHPATVVNKRLAASLTPLDATLTKNQGVGASLTFQPSNVQMRSLHPACSCGTRSDPRPNSFPHTFLATPHQLTPYLSHSYNNHGGHPPSFPSLFPRPLRSLDKECFSTRFPSTASALFLKIAGCMGSAPTNS